MIFRNALGNRLDSETDGWLSHQEYYTLQNSALSNIDGCAHAPATVCKHE